MAKRLACAGGLLFLSVYDGLGQDDFGGMDMDDMAANLMGGGMAGMEDMMGGMGGMEDMMGGYGDEEDGDDMGGGGAGGSARGALRLDSVTFDKIVGVDGYSVLVKFDEQYPFGDKEQEFKTLAPLAENVPNFFIAEVGVAEQVLEDAEVTPEDDDSNADLASRFGLKQADWPAYLLFKSGKMVARYSGAISASVLSAWLRRQGIKMPAIGTIGELDDLAERFVKTLADADIAEAERLVAEEYKDDKQAPIYVKLMKRIKEKGVAYVSKEIARLEKILGGQIAEEKKAELSEKLKILNSFLPPGSPGKDEL